MAQYNLTCVDPNHASRSAEPDWVDVLGTTEADEAPTDSGLLCPACDRLGGGMTFAENKAQKIAEIDQRTREIIETGFLYGGQTYSLSDRGQLKILWYLNMAASLTYPVSVDVIDDSAKTSLVDEAAVTAWAKAARDALKSALDSGTTLKTSVRSAVTIADVRAIEDNR